MTTKELTRVLQVLEKVGPKPNPFVEEAIAYVKKDLAIRDQQRKAMYDMNHENAEYPWYGQ